MDGEGDLSEPLLPPNPHFLQVLEDRHGLGCTARFNHSPLLLPITRSSSAQTPGLTGASTVGSTNVA